MKRADVLAVLCLVAVVTAVALVGTTMGRPLRSVALGQCERIIAGWSKCRYNSTWCAPIGNNCTAQTTKLACNTYRGGNYTWEMAGVTSIDCEYNPNTWCVPAGSTNCWRNVHCLWIGPDPGGMCTKTDALPWHMTATACTNK